MAALASRPGSWRYVSVQLGLFVLLGLAIGRLVQLQVLQKNFLIAEGTSRWHRVELVNAPRGALTDRHGEPLAISTPVVSIWADPRELEPADLPQLASAAGVDAGLLRDRAALPRAFMYVRRHLTPVQADAVLNLKLPGVYAQREYRRYYPAGEVAAHLIGITDVDDRGLEGAERAFDDSLSAVPGKQEVIRDLLGRSVRAVAELKPAQRGEDLQLKLDLRLQYLAYRELKQAIATSGAVSGSVVMMDVHSGEILALVNQPGYNPNDRAMLDPAALRNRAITDLIEPGSVIKPLAMALALEQGLVTPNTSINTSPGYLQLGKFTIRDIRDYGRLSATEIIQKSSNVGMVKIARRLDKQSFWQGFYDFGFAEPIGLFFPGEANGSIPNPMRWSQVTQGALAYGYGLAITPLHLAQAYATLANGGKRVHAHLVDGVSTMQSGQQVVSATTAEQVLKMMQTAVQPGGTAQRAALEWYSVAGKTGTSQKVGAGGYEEAKYVASFVGIAPATAPQIVTVVVINEPPTESYYGGQVAAPVFREIMRQALPLLQISPDRVPSLTEPSS